MKRIGTALAGLAVLTMIGCGDKATAPTEEPKDTTATVEEVTASFEAWRYKRASRVGNDEITISVDDVSCEIDSPGAATCYERITVDSVYLGKQVQDNVWDVEYDEADGEITYAKALGESSNSDSPAPGGVPS